MINKKKGRGWKEIEGNMRKGRQVEESRGERLKKNLNNFDQWFVSI